MGKNGEWNTGEKQAFWKNGEKWGKLGKNGELPPQEQKNNVKPLLKLLEMGKNGEKLGKMGKNGELFFLAGG